jgi:hypothetical protein
VETEASAKTLAITATPSSPAAERMVAPRPEGDSRRLVGAVQAERNRLARTRWKGRAKIALIALAAGAAVGGAVLAGKHYVPIALQLLKRPPPPPVTENQEGPVAQPDPTPAPAPKVSKKRNKRTRNGKATGDTAAAGDSAAPGAESPAAPPSGDEPLPPESK